MKKLILPLLIIFAFVACDEIMPVIPDPPPPGDRIVLMEEFSGGKCVPCADAAVIIAEISAQYPETFVPITIHTFIGGQADPYSGAKYDFRTEDGQALIEFLGLPNGIPSGVINRKLFEGEADLQLPKSKWQSLVQSAVIEKTSLNIGLATTFDADTRELTIESTLIPLEDISGDLRLIALVNESHLIDKQAVSGGDGLDPEFEHNHILRDVITPINGIAIDDLTAQESVTNTISYVIPEDDQDWWNPTNMEVVVFVVNNTGAGNDVLQSKAKHFAE